jgi:hypothetical protein
VKLIVGDDVEEGGLTEIDGEGLLKRVVEDGIAGGVCEIGEDDGVFGSELRGSTRVPEVATTCEE